MIDVSKAFPIEFRRDVVAVARKGQAPLSQIAKDFGDLGVLPAPLAPPP
jgi:transposase